MNTTGEEQWERETIKAWDAKGVGQPWRVQVGKTVCRVYDDGVWDVRGAYHSASTVPQELEAAKAQALRVARGEAR